MPKTPKRPFRERVPRIFSRKAGQRWSGWYTALVPNGKSINHEPRQKGDSGVIYSNIRMHFPESEYNNGIYELRVYRGKKKYVVYIGGTYRKDSKSIQERVMEYCNGGSHKDELINRVMEDGYKLSVRAMNLGGTKKKIWQSEDEYLEKYDYAWNKRKNGPIRKNVPPK